MNKYGNLGNLPPTKQEIVANTCPMPCGGKEGSAVLCARPLMGTIASWWSRCQRCLCYWETSPAGQIVVLKTVWVSDLCPDCRDLKSPHEVHVCGTKQEV